MDGIEEILEIEGIVDILGIAEIDDIEVGREVGIEEIGGITEFISPAFEPIKWWGVIGILMDKAEGFDNELIIPALSFKMWDVPG